MNILYIGPGRYRAEALRRLGHDVEFVDPNPVLPRSRLMRQLNFRTGYRLFTGAVLRMIQTRVGNRRFDVAWTDGGHLIAPECVRWLKTRARFVVNYCFDDPTGPRDASKWTTFCRAIPDYDLCVVVRDFNRKEYLDRGAKDVLFAMRSYDEIAHARLPYSAGDEKTWSSEVVFAGTWMPERGPFLAELIRRGVPLSIYGDRWEKAAEWRFLKKNWRGPSVRGPNYVKAIQYAKVAIGMLSKGNRDLHTTRSAEIPYIGTAFCAERTSEHLEMFREGVEALFWETPEECAEKCAVLLEDEAVRGRVARAARARLPALGMGNQDICGAVLSRLAAQQNALQHCEGGY